MRDKSKVNFTGQLKADTMAKLIKISVVEFLIESYEDKPMVKPEPQIKPVAQSKVIVSKIANPEIKEAPKRFSLADELAKLKV